MEKGRKEGLYFVIVTKKVLGVLLENEFIHTAHMGGPAVYFDLSCTMRTPLWLLNLEPCPPLIAPLNACDVEGVLSMYLLS